MKKAFLVSIVPFVLAGTIFSLYGVEVTATIERDGNDNRCPLSSPVFVTVKNYTFSTIRDVTFDLELFKDNRSKNVLKGNINRVFDTVTSPFSHSTGCFSDSYIRSFTNPNQIDIATQKQAVLSSLQSIKGFREFETRHTVHISNVETTFLN